MLPPPLEVLEGKSAEQPGPALSGGWSRRLPKVHCSLYYSRFHDLIHVFPFISHFCLLTEPDVTIVSGLKDMVVSEGDDVTFRCQVSHENARDVEWKLQDVALQSNEINEISVEKGKIHTLTLRKVTEQDIGTITFRVGAHTSRAELTVKGEGSLWCGTGSVGTGNVLLVLTVNSRP